jgi:hypothetical protein
MDSKIAREILDDLIPSLEAVEAKSTAVLEFLKREGIADDGKLAPYLEQAASASNVRWLGVRVRLERLLSAAAKDSAQKQIDKEEKKKPETEQTKAAEASQPQPRAGDNSKSAGPENRNENSGKDKKVEKMPKDSEPKSKDENVEKMGKDSDSKSSDMANESKRNHKNGDHQQASEEPAAADAKRKVA